MHMIPKRMARTWITSLVAMTVLMNTWNAPVAHALTYDEVQQKVTEIFTSIDWNFPRPSLGFFPSMVTEEDIQTFVIGEDDGQLVVKTVIDGINWSTAVPYDIYLQQSKPIKVGGDIYVGIQDEEVQFLRSNLSTGAGSMSFFHNANGVQFYAKSETRTINGLEAVNWSSITQLNAAGQKLTQNDTFYKTLKSLVSDEVISQEHTIKTTNFEAVSGLAINQTEQTRITNANIFRIDGPDILTYERISELRYDDPANQISAGSGYAWFSYNVTEKFFDEDGGYALYETVFTKDTEAIANDHLMLQEQYDVNAEGIQILKGGRISYKQQFDFDIKYQYENGQIERTSVVQLFSDGSIKGVVHVLGGEGYVDIPTIADRIENVLRGDLDQDGTVGLQDFAILKSNFGKKGQTILAGNIVECWNCVPDEINVNDFNVLKANMGSSSGSAILDVLPEDSITQNTPYYYPSPESSPFPVVPHAEGFSDSLKNA